MHGDNDRMGSGYASFLDLVRWVSAWLVFFQHLRDPILIGYSDLPAQQRTPLVSAFYYVTGLGPAAVTIFFVISGYLIGGSG